MKNVGILYEVLPQTQDITQLQKRKLTVNTTYMQHHLRDEKSFVRLQHILQYSFYEIYVIKFKKLLKLTSINWKTF